MNWQTPKSLSKQYISGFTFNNACKYNLCPRYPQRFDTNFSEDDVIFINLDSFESLASFFESTSPKSLMTILTHNSDRDFTEQMFFRIERFVKKIYAINCSFSHPKICKIPLGLNDQSAEIIDKMDLSFKDKENLVYVNFKLGHHQDRPDCFEYFRQSGWATVEPLRMNGHDIMPAAEFFKKMNTFKYCISPRGAGIDTHRIYESLLLGVLPIVRSSVLDDLYEKMPVIIVNDWNEVTREFLEDKYENRRVEYMKWREENKEWFLPQYWIKKIL